MTKTTGNFLASGPAPSTPSPAPAAPAAAPYKMPVSDGSSKMPMIGDRQRIAKPSAPQISGSKPPARQNNDRTSGMSSSLGAMADQLHPVKRR